jgi:hypothetical protein
MDADASPRRCRQIGGNHEGLMAAACGGDARARGDRRAPAPAGAPGQAGRGRRTTGSAPLRGTCARGGRPGPDRCAEEAPRRAPAQRGGARRRRAGSHRPTRKRRRPAPGARNAAPGRAARSRGTRAEACSRAPVSAASAAPGARGPSAHTCTCTYTYTYTCVPRCASTGGPLCRRAHTRARRRARAFSRRARRRRG